jgi:hypothetical protein
MEFIVFYIIIEYISVGNGHVTSYTEEKKIIINFRKIIRAKIFKKNFSKFSSTFEIEFGYIGTSLTFLKIYATLQFLYDLLYCL